MLWYVIHQWIDYTKCIPAVSTTLRHTLFIDGLSTCFFFSSEKDFMSVATNKLFYSMALIMHSIAH